MVRKRDPRYLKKYKKSADNFFSKLEDEPHNGETKQTVELTPSEKFVSWFAWVASAAIVVYIFNTL